MDILSIFLAKLFGAALIVIGLFFLSRTKTIKAAVSEISKSPALLTFAGIMRLFIGLSMVYSHNIWIFEWPVIITLIGYLILITGILMLFLQNKMISFVLRSIKGEGFFKSMGIAFLVIGALLSYHGFWAV